MVILSRKHCVILGANVNIMPKAMLWKLNYPLLHSTLVQLQLADSAIRTPERVLLNISVKILGKEIREDFVVLDMESREEKISLILGRPFQYES